jgi:excisionase family DNA binding protein
MVEILYTTEDLSKMFRVGKSTIKRWTDEGKLQCFKTPGGHRKFKPANVHQFVSHYHYEVVTPLLPFARTGETISADAATIGAEDQLMECFVGAIKGRRHPIETMFSSLTSGGMSLPVMFDMVLTPVIRMIHEKHLQQHITSVEFHIARNTLIHALIHFADLLPKKEKKGIELYCLSVHEGMNEVELKAVELLLDTMGLTVYNLGTVLTKHAADDIVNQCRPEDVFVVLSLDHSSDEIIGQFNALVAGVKSYGGNVYTSNFFEDKRSTSFVSTGSEQMHSFSEIAERIALQTESSLPEPVRTASSAILQVR